MAKNTYKKQGPLKDENSNHKGFFNNIGQYINIENWVESLPKNYLNYSLWLLGLVFVYIYAQHSNETLLRKSDRLKDSLEVLRLEYVSKKAGYMQQTKKSAILQKVQPLGLEENTTRPYKIVLDE
jgi:hypothetical protein